MTANLKLWVSEVRAIGITPCGSGDVFATTGITTGVVTASTGTGTDGRRRASVGLTEPPESPDIPSRNTPPMSSANLDLMSALIGDTYYGVVIRRRCVG